MVTGLSFIQKQGTHICAIPKHAFVTRRVFLLEVCTHLSVQVAQWSPWGKYPGHFGNRDCSRRHGPVVFQFCNSDKTVSITGAGRLSPSPDMPEWHYLALNYSKYSAITLEIEIYLRGVCKGTRSSCPGRRMWSCPRQWGRFEADVKDSIGHVAHLLLILPIPPRMPLLTYFCLNFWPREIQKGNSVGSMHVQACFFMVPGHGWG